MNRGISVLASEMHPKSTKGAFKKYQRLVQDGVMYGAISANEESI